MKKISVFILLSIISIAAVAETVTGTQFGTGQIYVTGKSKSPSSSVSDLSSAQIIDAKGDIISGLNTFVLPIKPTPLNGVDMCSWKLIVRKTIAKLIVQGNSSNLRLSQIDAIHDGTEMNLSYDVTQFGLVSNTLLSGTANAPQEYDISLAFKNSSSDKVVKNVTLYIEYAN